MTGGEEITARGLYEAASTYMPQFTLWLSCNDLPAVTDHSLFASERLRVIEFGRHFSASEQDKHLKEEFMEQDAMQGIFMWLIRGFKKYRQRGLGMPESLQLVVSQYKRDNDGVGQFLEANCVRDDGDGVRTQFKTMYEKYKFWCKAEGARPLSLMKFCGEMDRHLDYHSGRATVHGVNYWRGIRFKGASDLLKG